MSKPTKGERRKQDILNAAADLSTSEGLHGLSFSQVASEVGLTKAGVAAHFESKEALQLAVVDGAARSYVGALFTAAAATPPGLPRLRALVLAWLEHLESIPYRGGCFFAAAGQAFAGHPGPVRDAIAEHTRLLVQAFEEQAELALRLGELDPEVEPRSLVFQIHALAYEANMRRQLLDEADAFVTARAALDRQLKSAAVRGSSAWEKPS